MGLRNGGFGVDGEDVTVQKYYSSGSAQIAVRTVQGEEDTLQCLRRALKVHSADIIKHKMNSGSPYLQNLLLACGITLGFYLTWSRSEEPAGKRPALAMRPEKGELLFAGLLALPGAWIGARVAFVFLHWAYYQQNTAEVFRLWEGGLHWSGALLGALVVLLVFAGLTDRPLLQIIDGLLPLWVMTGITLWAATPAGYYVLSPQVASSLPAAVQKAGQAVSIPLTVALLSMPGGWLLLNSRKVGHPALLWVMLQIFLLLLVSFASTENAPRVGGMPYDCLAALVYMVGCAAVMALVQRWDNRTPPQG